MRSRRRFQVCRDAVETREPRLADSVIKFHHHCHFLLAHRSIKRDAAQLVLAHFNEKGRLTKSVRRRVEISMTQFWSLLMFFLAAQPQTFAYPPIMALKVRRSQVSTIVIGLELTGRRVIGIKSRTTPTGSFTI